MSYVGNEPKEVVDISTVGNLTVTGKVSMTSLGDFADDVAAAAGGVPINGLYRTANIVKIRVS